jgi:hypothetical protein
LNQGKHLTDLFSLAKIDGNEYEVRIESLSRFDKARILYSHIWHSSLPDAMLDELFAAKRYKTIADHRNFNPRLVSFITDSDLTGSVPVEEYWNHVVATLDNPQSLWDHFFEQISQDCRDMVYLVVLNGKSISESELKQAFRRLRGLHDIGRIEHDATVALKICTGSVLNRSVDARSGAVTYDLYNPSIGDYVFGKVADWAVCADLIASLRTCGSLRNLREMRSSKYVSAAAYKYILEVLAAMDSEHAANDPYMVELCELLLEQDDLVAEHKELLRRRLDGLEFTAYTGSDRVLLRLMSNGIRKGVVSTPNARLWLQPPLRATAYCAACL